MDILQMKEKKSYIRPLFWQHGEKKEQLIEEIKQMHENGVGGFIVEARPHPDFLSYGWWRDLDIIIHEAKKRAMEVWIFDDSSYPSGIGAGKIKALYPQFVKTYLAEHHIDVVGPKRNVTINVRAWIKASHVEGVHNLEGNEPEELICVLLAERTNGREQLNVESIKDITEKMYNGKIEIDIEEGSWRIFIITQTRNGGEEWTKDYVNPLSKEAVGQYIDIIYEEHYKRYSKEFGHTIKGFFCDEPRFGNVAGYEDIMWKSGVVYPYTDGLLEELSKEFGKDIKKYLPLLWANDNKMCHDVHYCYMNVVSRLFAKNFTEQIGDWCKNHHVQFTGHLVEDNGVHSRLGYGSGHFFRVMEGMDSSGMDLVYQVWPNHTEGRFTTPFGYLNAEFFYWGLAKMTSSSAHLDEKKNGIALCEIFGAYGWQMGLKFMKWLTDHVTVRGINLLVPHAFSPKYPDDDCPPHFYANGKNPQWKYFHIWSEYANRVCNILSDGIHHATAAVVYHAEAEWGGEYEPFEKVVRVLAEHQIDSDVVPIDYLIDLEKSRVVDGQLCIHKERYNVLIIPYSQCVSEEFLKKLIQFSEEKLPIIFMSKYPQKIYYIEQNSMLVQLKKSNIHICDYETIIEYMKDKKLYDVLLEKNDKYLRIYHYQKGPQEVYFITNEDPSSSSQNLITLPREGNWIAYDAMDDKMYALEKARNKINTFHIELAPYQSLFLMDVGHNNDIYHKPIPITAYGIEIKLENDWQVWIDQAEDKKVMLEIHRLENIASNNLYPEYSGRISYETNFIIDSQNINKKTYLYLGEVYETCRVKINGCEIGCKIAPPYNYDITNYMQEDNILEVEVTNTFVKEKGDNFFDRSMVQEPSGLLGPVKIVFCE